MIEFKEENIKYMALELPDEINFYKYSGDFDGELSAIERYMKRDISDGLKVRLKLEAVIAERMTHDYLYDFDGLLERIRKKYPACRPSDLEKFISMGHADYIRRGGVRYFESSAARNVMNCCRRQLDELESGNSIEASRYWSSRLHENLEIMKKQGGRAFRFRVREHIAPDDKYSRPGSTVCAHLPYPCECPEQSDIQLEASSHPVYISDSEHRTAFINAEHCDGADYWVEFSYTIREPYNVLDPNEVSAEQPDFCLDEELPQIRFTPAICALAAELAAGESNPLILARRAYDYVTTHVAYSYMRDYLCLDFIPGFAMLNGRGDCGVMALLFITLCRAMGVPARWQSGSHVEPDDIGSHDWAQFYVAPYGWLPADPSFGVGALRKGDVELWDHYFGNLDPFRQINCTGFAATFDPPRRYLRRDPYDNQSGEIEYADAPLWFGQISSSREVVSAEELEY